MSASPASGRGAAPVVPSRWPPRRLKEPTRTLPPRGALPVVLLRMSAPGRGTAWGPSGGRSAKQHRSVALSLKCAFPLLLDHDSLVPREKANCFSGLGSWSVNYRKLIKIRGFSGKKARKSKVFIENLSPKFGSENPNKIYPKNQLGFSHF